MSVKMMAKAWDTDVSGNDLLVLLVLCDFSNDEGELHPSLSTISKKAKVGKTTLGYILRAYEKIGVITRLRRKRENNSDTSNFYKINTLSFDSIAYKKAYQEIRNYNQDKSQCDTPNEVEKRSQCDTPDEIKKGHNVTPPLSLSVTPPLSLSVTPYMNHHINHHMNKKKYIQKENENEDLKIKPKELVNFYKENISNLQAKIKEVASTNAMALCPDGLEKILIGLRNYANDLPKDAFHITNLEKFIKEKFYLDYQEPTRKNTPLNPLIISDKKYTASEEF
jgi:hypothetical protein